MNSEQWEKDILQYIEETKEQNMKIQLNNFLTEFLSKQEPIDKEIEQILDVNKEELYEW